MSEPDRGPCQYCMGEREDGYADLYFDQLGEGEIRSGAVCYAHALDVLIDLYRGDKAFMLEDMDADGWERPECMYLGVCSSNHLAVALVMFHKEDFDEDNIAIDSGINVIAEEDCDSCKALADLWVEKFHRFCHRVWGEPLVSTEEGPGEVQF